jgi:hypothetical protein
MRAVPVGHHTFTGHTAILIFVKAPELHVCWKYRLREVTQGNLARPRKGMRDSRSASPGYRNN